MIGQLATQGSFVFYLPPPQSVLLYGDMDGTVCLGMLKAGATRVVCLCPELLTAMEIRKNVTGCSQGTIILVVGQPDALPFRENSFALVVRHVSSVSEMHQGAALRPLIVLFRECFRVVSLSGTVYFSVGTKKNFVGGACQKIILLTLLILTVIFRRIAVHFILFYYPSFIRTCFIRGFSPADLVTGEKLLFAVKRLAGGNSFGVSLSRSAECRSGANVLGKIRKIIELRSGIVLGTLFCLRPGSGGGVIGEFANYIVRIPMNRPAGELAERNYNALTFLSGRRLSMVTPDPVVQVGFAGFHIYCETRLPGVSLDLYSGNMYQGKEFVKMVMLSISDHSLVLSDLLPNDLEIYVDRPLLRIHRVLFMGNKSLVGQVQKKVRRQLLQWGCPLVITHGDFKKSNFILNQDEQVAAIGLIDWECSSIPGMPLFDLLRFWTFDVKGWEDEDVHIISSLWENVYNEMYPEEVLNYCVSFNIPFALLPALYLLFLVNHVLTYCSSTVLSKGEQEKTIGSELLTVFQSYLDIPEYDYG